ncbi:MAG: translation elongation factor 4 [Candidatus Shikimatogenerans sp. Tduv]|uniref:Elongation factor 4 n=1 Tax=Candidatus Shikimatogenerans sp. Tduv TaxID=3158567 RepID=A0AAU7QQY8_9FLAO
MIKYIRNFCIIAHIDHGKSTLVNSFLKISKEINIKEKKIILDNMYLEKKRGITIKCKTIQIKIIYKKKKYYLNLIDTPGHIDFNYEVLKSIYACEGALLLVDCSKNIQSQTISNYLLAKKNNLYIIPIINKIDLNIKLDNVEKKIINLLNCKKKDILYISAKKNLGIDILIKNIIKKIPYPKYNKLNSLEILVFNFKYLKFKKLIIYSKIISGIIKKNQYIYFINNNKKYKIEELGIIKYNKNIIKKKLIAGEVGYLIINLNIKDLDKITNIIVDENHNNKKITSNIMKIKNIKPIVFVNIFVHNIFNSNLEYSLKQLKLDDNSFIYRKYNSKYLGMGYKCGFLGMLHMEIIINRLENEYNHKILVTYPSVKYKILLKNKKNIYIDSYDILPEKKDIYKIYEPYVIINIITIDKYMGKIINFCITNRGKLKSQKILFNNQINLIFLIPLYEIIYNFYNMLKSLSNGYINLDYYFYKYKKVNLVKISFLINNKNINSLSYIINKENSLKYSKYICLKLKNYITRKQFLIKINVKINNKIILKKIIKPFRKNVISKCYGGDITRKKKLLNKQKRGKNRIKKFNKIIFNKKIFLNILNINK